LSIESVMSAWDRHATEKYPNFRNSGSRSTCALTQYDTVS